MGKETVSGQPPRQDRMIKEHVHDPYMTRKKLHDPTVCPDCSVVYQKGRWQWPAGPVEGGQEEAVCPACRRIRDRYPAGWVRLSGSFMDRHEYEILQLVRHQEEMEKKEHPLDRIMEITKEDGDLLITTTDIHLPRRIGEAVHHAFQGELGFSYEEESYRVRVDWSRDA